jgi:hypothetical protein
MWTTIGPAANDSSIGGNGWRAGLREKTNRHMYGPSKSRARTVSASHRQENPSTCTTA